MKEWEKEGRKKEGIFPNSKVGMSHSDIKYSELFLYILDFKLVPIIRRRPPNVHSKYIILPVFFRNSLKSLFCQLGTRYLGQMEN